MFNKKKYVQNWERNARIFFYLKKTNFKTMKMFGSDKLWDENSEAQTTKKLNFKNYETKTFKFINVG